MAKRYSGGRQPTMADLLSALRAHPVHATPHNTGEPGFQQQYIRARTDAPPRPPRRVNPLGGSQRTGPTSRDRRQWT